MVEERKARINDTITALSPLRSARLYAPAMPTAAAVALLVPKTVPCPGGIGGNQDGMIGLSVRHSRVIATISQVASAPRLLPVLDPDAPIARTP